MAGLKPVRGMQGTFELATGERVTAVETREGDFYDTIEITSQTLTAGTEFKWFDSFSNKKGTATNLSASTIPNEHFLELTRIGVYVRSAAAQTLATGNNSRRIYEGGFCEFALQKSRTIAEGPAILFQAGLGITGNATDTVANGVASSAAAPILSVTQDITDEMTLLAKIGFPSDTWRGVQARPVVDGPTDVSCFFHGIITKAQGA